MNKWTRSVLALLALAVLQACATRHPSIPAAAPEVLPPGAAAAPAPPAPVSRALDAASLPPSDAQRETLVAPLRGIKRIDRASSAEDIWQRIRHGFAMPDLDNALVRRKTAEYARQPDYLQRVFERSRFYLYHIVEELVASTWAPSPENSAFRSAS